MASFDLTAYFMLSSYTAQHLRSTKMEMGLTCLVRYCSECMTVKMCTNVADALCMHQAGKVLRCDSDLCLVGCCSAFITVNLYMQS